MTHVVEDKFQYFFKMGKVERKMVEDWLGTLVCKTERQKRFVNVVKRAVKAIKYDYYISTIEPSMNEDGEIYFKTGEEVERKITFKQWEEKGTTFAPERESKLATLSELFLWYAYRIATMKWTIEYVCDDSSEDGNYHNAPDAAQKFEESGARTVGGFFDGVGNTYKIVKGNPGFALCGGYHGHNGDCCPVADAYSYNGPDGCGNIGSGVFVLLK